MNECRFPGGVCAGPCDHICAFTVRITDQACPTHPMRCIEEVVRRCDNRLIKWHCSHGCDASNKRDDSPCPHRCDYRWTK